MKKFQVALMVLAVFLVVLPAAVFADSTATSETVFTVGQSAYWQNGQSNSMDAAPVMIDGRVYLPAEGVADAFGMTAKWVPQLSEIVFLPPTAPPSQISGGIMRESVNGQGTMATTMTVALSLTGPAGSHSIQAGLDTGSSMTVFPDSYLRSLGFQPASGLMAGNTVQGSFGYYYYKVPLPALIQDGRQIPLGQGTAKVMGVVGANEALVGLDILSADSLTLQDGAWTLTVPKAN